MTDDVTQADIAAANHAFDIAFQGNTDTIDNDMAVLFARHRQAAEQAAVDKIVAWLEDQSDMCCDACAREIQNGEWKQ